jgi:hypothetical protein
LDCVISLDVVGHLLAGEGLDKNLHLIYYYRNHFKKIDEYCIIKLTIIF